MCVVLFIYFVLISGERFFVIKCIYVYNVGFVIEICLLIVFGLGWILVFILYILFFIDKIVFYCLNNVFVVLCFVIIVFCNIIVFCEVY